LHSPRGCSSSPLEHRVAQPQPASRRQKTRARRHRWTPRKTPDNRRRSPRRRALLRTIRVAMTRQRRRATRRARPSRRRTTASSVASRCTPRGTRCTTPRSRRVCARAQAHARANARASSAAINPSLRVTRAIRASLLLWIRTRAPATTPSRPLARVTRTAPICSVRASRLAKACDANGGAPQSEGEYRRLG